MSRRKKIEDTNVLIGMTGYEMISAVKKLGMDATKQFLPGAVLVFFISNDICTSCIVNDGTVVEPYEDPDKSVIWEHQRSVNDLRLVFANLLTTRRFTKFEDVIKEEDPTNYDTRTNTLSHRFYSDPKKNPDGLGIRYDAFLKLFKPELSKKFYIDENARRNNHMDPYEEGQLIPIDEDERSHLLENEERSLRPYSVETWYYNIGDLAAKLDSFKLRKMFGRVTTCKFVFLLNCEGEIQENSFQMLLKSLKFTLHRKISTVSSYFTNKTSLPLLEKLTLSLPKLQMKGKWQVKSRCTRRIWIWT